MSTYLGADLIVETLAREGVRHVFTVPGGQMIPIHYAIDDHESMELVIPRHEGAAALMACGYSMAGLPSCVMTTVGAGIAYEAGSLAFAWRERLPVISIAPQVQSHKMKPIQENLQACDQDEIFAPITKFHAIMYHRDRIPALIRRAVKFALSPEPGPVHLDTPVDVIFGFKRVSRSKKKNLFPDRQFRFDGKVIPSRESVLNAARVIGLSARALVLVGRNVERSRAGEYLMKFLSAAGIPVITSAAAWSSVPGDSELRIGHAGLWRNDTTLRLLARTDTLVLIEADEETGRLAREIVARNGSVLVVQTAELASAVGSLVPVTAGITGSVIPVLEELAASVKSREGKTRVDREWLSSLMKAGEFAEKGFLRGIGPAQRIKRLSKVFDTINSIAGPDTLIVCEGSMVCGSAMLRLKREGLHNTVMLDDGYSAGAGFPLSLGMKCAFKNRKVILFSDADSFKRHSREIQTMIRYNLPLVIFLFQDKDRKPREEVDFARFAKSFGLEGRIITDPDREMNGRMIRDALESPCGVLFDMTL
ncbi:MAG TPA: thiamine pyrophosphate-binding protein [Spirochaetota bacterium]|nr:thiamine pyrophosphate-binding protein [Spirochaetota bacterium]HRZ28227.1 thiamine pyrophosphate-binding protein [Spirochaetota bacterium]HSA13871.1 thiamine pyrophosphate-binding protein [Spirochaetota bacterium]